MNTPRFAPGERVAVAARHPGCHHRVPAYAKGRTGEIERLCGVFGNPESLAHGGDGRPAQPLYRVRFRADHLWGGRAERPGDTVEIEIYQHWLEPAP